MQISTRRFILRFDAAFLCIAAIAGLLGDIAGIWFNRGPMAVIVGAAPNAGIGLVEAHGLAFIVGLLMWRAASELRWHLAAAYVHLVLGSANLLFWNVFVVSDALAIGYVTTAAHGLLVLCQLTAAISASRDATSMRHAVGG